MIPDRQDVGGPTIVVGSVDGHCPGSVLGCFGSFFWGFLWGPLEVVPARFQRYYNPYKFIYFKNEFYPKQTPIRRPNSLGSNMTYDERLRGCLSNALDVLGSLT